MSLTSYRAAPPRDNLACAVYQPGPFGSTASLALDLWLLHPASKYEARAYPARFERYVAMARADGKGEKHDFS